MHNPTRPKDKKKKPLNPFGFSGFFSMTQGAPKMQKQKKLIYKNDSQAGGILIFGTCNGIVKPDVLPD